MNEHIDIEVKRMSKESIEMLNNLSAVCKRYGINYYRATRFLRSWASSAANAAIIVPHKTELVFTQGSVQICTGSFLLR